MSPLLQRSASATASTGDASTGGADTGTSRVGSTTLLLDVGTDKDGGDNKPPGCQGKIDFLFVVARDGKIVKDPKPWTALGTAPLAHRDGRRR